MIFEGKNLEEVYKKASEHFTTSISELQIRIIQAPSNGLFGLFSKKAIIEVEESKISEKESKEESQTIEETEQKLEKSEIVETLKEKIEQKAKIEEFKEQIKENRVKQNIEKEEIKEIKKETKQSNVKQKVEKAQYFEYEIEKISIENIVELAKKEVNELFKLSCFKIDEIDVKVYDDETIIFIIDGEDAALLIGKEGYRYNAISTMLFNWISQKYGYKVKLEIAQFLEQQEEMMRKLLEPYIREIEEKGRSKTKSFDGVLVYLALDILRSEFPDKYVAIKKNRDGSQYIIINRFLNKNE